MTHFEDVSVLVCTWNRAALLVVAAAMDNKSREEAPRRVRRGQDSKRLERNNGKLIVFHAR